MAPRGGPVPIRPPLGHGRPKMATWHVYQFRSETELLYVGYTRQLKTRLGQHKRDKPWWPEVTDVRAEEFTTEDEARRREKELWADRRPKYNRKSPFQTKEELREYHRKWARKYREIPENRQ